MKKHLRLVGCAVAGIIIHHFSALAETAKPNSTAAAPAAISAPLKTNEQISKKAKDCDDEWKADQERMMKYGMTEDSYVEQCSLADDVPAIPPLPKRSAAPSAEPK